MVTGLVTSLKPQRGLEREFVGLPFDARPWPVVVGMLAALVGVFFALRPAAGGGERIERQSTIAAPALADAKESIEQGVTLSFEQGGKRDVRSARVMALYVPEHSAPTPFLQAGPFTATFSGFVNLRLRGEFSFQVQGRGKVVVKIGGKTVLEAAGEDFADKASAVLKMEKGKNPIEVVYTSPEKGDARVRVLWTSRDFPPEPVQPTVLSHDVAEKSLREAARLREGRELLARLRCGNCHTMPTAEGKGLAMVELQADAPDLSDAGARLKQGWMAAWIAEPRKWRADASMPKLFHSANGTAAADVAAYLATLGKPAEVAAVEADDEAVAQGGQLFAGLGCIGCHTKPDAEEADKEGVRVPLSFLNAKFQPGALKGWLINPQAHYAATRMPNFHLTDFEADRLVAYLSKNARGGAGDEVKGDAAKGKTIFASAGCANCHKMKDVPSGLAAESMADLLASSDWSKGCLAAEVSGAAPDFGLSAEQRGAVMAFAAQGIESLHNDVLPELAERSIQRLQCMACHARDEVEDRWSNLADEVADMAPPETNVESDQTADTGDKGPKLFVPRGLGQLHGGDQIVISGDQTRPLLTWTGEKLRPEWAGPFIDGKLTYKPRYWMRARMPAFAGRGEGIAQGLALEHGFAAQSGPVPTKFDAKLAELGKKLIARDGGFACIQCHSVVDTKAIGVFEAPAPNFMHATTRLTHDYYLRWVRKPMRFQPGTKMPQYAEGGKTTLKEILDGDADKQFEAIWNYLLQGEGMVPPE